MSDGTTLNGVYAPGIHRSNAGAVVRDATGAIQHSRDRLLMLAVSTPRPIADGAGEPVAWHHYALREVDDAVDEILEYSHAQWKAQYIIDNPRDVVDDYDNAFAHASAGQDAGENE